MACADWPLLTRLCRQALRKNSRHLAAHRLLGFALHRKRDSEAALVAYRQSASLWPQDAELLINYANVLLELAKNDRALPLLEKVVQLRPDHSACWSKLAQSCYALGLHQKGFDASVLALKYATDTAQRVAALTQSAIHRRELGEVQQAVKDCEEVIRLAPTDPSGHTNRMLFMLADPTATAQQVTVAAREYGAAFEPQLKPFWPDFSAHPRGPWRRLKIGFLSPDFRMHAVMYFVEGLLAQLDRRQFEVFAFYLYPKDDHITERVRCHADHFVHMASFSASEQAQMIRDHGIDIVVDLAGHTGNTGLLALAHKAAPVQISWLGFPATTGLSAVDFKFTDEITDPADAEEHYTERLYRLPVLFICYRPMSRNPLWRYQPRYQVRQTPGLDNGHVTFGSCNNLGKLTDEVLSLWGRVLAAVPGSRLLIEGKGLHEKEFADAYRSRCEGLGIPGNLLELVTHNSANQYLTYHRIDIALDPFPLTGGTTTCDVLWMGVPLVSMVGESFKSRMGTGILSYLGRTDWLAESPDDYVRIARSLASDLHALNTTRSNLRAEMENSPLMREDIFNHHFGEGLRAMWVEWLAKSEAPDNPEAQQQLMASWMAEVPQEWTQPPSPEVGLAPGQRVSLQTAYHRLHELIDKAKSTSSEHQPKADSLKNHQWVEATALAETILCAVPHDPVALSGLAEIEFAHGHHEFAVTYLRYATEAMGNATTTSQ